VQSDSKTKRQLEIKTKEHENKHKTNRYRTVLVGTFMGVRC